MITLRLARLIATNLGWGWRYSDGYLTNNSEAFLNGPSGERIKLVLGNASHRTSEHGRLLLVGLLDEVTRYLPYQVTNATYMITVADSTPPSTIAAQIRSRLLPEYVKALNTGQAAKRVADDEARAREDLITLVADQLGECDRIDSTLRFGKIHDPIRGQVIIRSGNSESQIVIKVSRDYIRDLTFLLGSFLRHTRATNQPNDGNRHAH